MKKTAIVPIYWNSRQLFCRVKEGRTLSLHHSAPTDEGYEYESKEIYLEDGMIYKESASGGCDCDGPIHHYSDDVCPVERLYTIISPNGKFVWPDWKELRAWHRDVYAEAAGY